LGQDWQILRQYFKPHAVCRWAQPAIEGALALQQTHQIQPEHIRRIRVTTFHQAVRLNCRRPQDTETAQYSLPFPVAAALVHGRLGAAELVGVALSQPETLALADKVELIESEAFNARFPARRFARVELETVEGERYDSGEVEARWNADDPPMDEALRAKFRWLARSRLPQARTAELEALVWNCADLPEVSHLAALIETPVE
jgi:2-methylcitrate dehydratase PrpD